MAGANGSCEWASDAASVNSWHQLVCLCATAAAAAVAETVAGTVAGTAMVLGRSHVYGLRHGTVGSTGTVPMMLV